MIKIKDTAIEFAEIDSVQSIIKLEKSWEQEGINKDMNPYTYYEVRSAILEKRIILAKYELKVIGFLFFEINRKDKSCELDAIYVSNNYRKKGIGHLLMDFFLKIKIVASCNKIYLLADSVNEPDLIKFYSNYEFKKVAVKMVRINHPL